MKRIDSSPLVGPLPAATPPPGMRLFQLPTGSYRTRAAFAFRGGRWGDQRDFAATAVLIHHPRGDLLIDAGFGANAEQHIDMLPTFRRSPHDLGATASQQLNSAGYDRERLLGVALTHSHWDHVSGLDSMDVPIWMARDERRYADQAKDDRVFATVSVGHEIREYALEGPAFLGFRSSHDFYGDGSVVIVPAGGHTPGSVVIFVAIPSGRRYAFIGDLTWQLDAVTLRVDRPFLMRTLADTDAEQVRRDLARVLAIAERMQIVPAHDARGYTGIPQLTPQSLTEPA